MSHSTPPDLTMPERGPLVIKQDSLAFSAPIVIAIILGAISVTTAFMSLQNTIKDLQGKSWDVDKQRAYARETEQVNKGFVSPNVDSINRQFREGK